MAINKLVNYWNTSGWVSMKTICELHDPLCRCSKPGKELLIDFDEIKDKYSIQYSIESPSSVDGFCHRKSELLFVEIKGWTQFIDRKPNITEEKIDKQINKFKLIKKLKDSLDICLGCILKEQIGVEDDFRNYPKRFIIVTDIDISQKPLQSLAANLQMLAANSTSWETICTDKMRQHVDSLSMNQYSGYNFKPVNFISCFDFDEYCKRIF